MIYKEVTMLMLFNKFLLTFGVVCIVRRFIEIYIEKDEQQ